MQILLILILLLGGTSVVAERSLPGDALYSVKVNVNEQVADFFAAGAKADALWHAHAIERRLDEAEKLAAKGALSTEAQAQLESNFKLHAAIVDTDLARLKTDGDLQAEAKISSDFASLLKAHEATLASYSVAGSDESAASLHMMVSEEATKNQSETEEVKKDEDNESSDMNMMTQEKSEDGLIDMTSSSGLMLDINGSGSTSSERSTGGMCKQPAPSSYGRNACCDMKTGQWYLGDGSCVSGGSI